jgi:hypothetical protein
MTSPSYSNIDRWLFDYFEGNLSTSQIEALELFILENPELDVDLEAWEAIQIQDDIDNDSAIALIQQHSIKHFISIPYKEVLGFASLVAVFFCSLLWTSENEITSSSLPRQQQEKTYHTKEKTTLTTNQTSHSFVETKATQQLENKLANNQMSIENAYSLQKNNTANHTAIVPNNITLSEVIQPILSNLDSRPSISILSMKFIESAYTLSFGKHGIVPISKTQSSNNSILERKIKRSNSNQLSEFNKFKLSMKQKMRSIKRMMDYPIALKNSRTPHLYLPEHTLQDINFGFVGASFTPILTLQSRMQWLNYNNSQYVNSINYGSYVYGVRGGIGAQIKNTYYGDGIVKGTEASITYSPKISLNATTTIEPSIRFKMGNKQLNLGNELFNQSIEIDRGNSISLLNQEKNPIGSSLWYKDVGLGLLINSKYFYAGIQVDNVFKHYDNLFATEINNSKRSNNHILLTFGTDYENVKKTVRVSPSIIYQKLGDLSEIWLGVNYQYKKIMINGSLSNHIEPSLGVGFEFKRFGVFYHADYLNSTVNASQSLSHQFGIKFMGRKSKINKL